MRRGGQSSLAASGPTLALPLTLGSASCAPTSGLAPPQTHSGTTASLVREVPPVDAQGAEDSAWAQRRLPSCPHGREGAWAVLRRSPSPAPPKPRLRPHCHLHLYLWRVPTETEPRPGSMLRAPCLVGWEPSGAGRRAPPPAAPEVRVSAHPPRAGDTSIQGRKGAAVSPHTVGATWSLFPGRFLSSSPVLSPVTWEYGRCGSR